MFKFLGVMLALYVVHAVWTGEVYAKSGASGRRVSRAETPASFWIIVVIYCGLSLALVTVF